MTAEALRSRLAHRDGDLAGLAERTAGSVTLVEIPAESRFDLRVDPEVARGRAVELPPVNAVSRRGPRATLWLGPDEWLVTGPAGDHDAIRAELRRAVEGLHASVVDVSANFTAMDLGGVGARDLLAAGCSIDLHPSRWTPRSCAQTLVARAPVILEQLDERTTRIYVRPSFADYLVDRLLASA